MTECQKDNEPMIGSCCCNCRFHLKDHAHCSTVVERNGECVCHVQKGWVCAAPEHEGIVYSGWTEHGKCEMWEATNEV